MAKLRQSMSDPLSEARAKCGQTRQSFSSLKTGVPIGEKYDKPVYLCLCSYAIEGQSQKVADNIYLFTPGHFDIIIPTQDQFGGGKDDVMKSGEGF